MRFIWIVLMLLFLFLFVVYISHPRIRSFVREGFEGTDYSMPSVDLSKEPEFMAFKKFHGEVCGLWNTVIDEVMKNECVDPESKCPPKPQYIKKLQLAYNVVSPTPACFINCDEIWDETSSLATLQTAIPENINCYKGTLEFVIANSTNMLKQVQESLDKVAAGFADYKETILCVTDSSNNTVCTDPNGKVYIPKQETSTATATANPDTQAFITNTIISRCRSMNTEIPVLKMHLAKAKEQVAQLKMVQKKANDGTLLPPPAKSA